MKRTLRSLCAAGLMLTVHQAAAETPTIRLGADGAYQPYGYRDAAGNLIGFEPDLATALCAHIEARCEWVLMDFDGLIPALKSGRIDAVMAALSKTEARAKVIDYSLPYTSGPEYLVTSTEFAEASNVSGGGVLDMFDLNEEASRTIDMIREDLDGKTVGVGRGTTMETFIRQTFPGAGLRLYDEHKNALLDLTSGRIDVAMTDGEVAEMFIQEQAAKGNAFSIYGPGLRGGALGEGVAFGVAKGNDDLIGRLNGGVLELTRDGTIAQLSTKWFNQDYSISVRRLERELSDR